MRVVLVILLVLAQIVTPIGVAAGATAPLPAARSCCCGDTCKCATGRCCVRNASRPVAPAPPAPGQPAVEKEWASLLPVVALFASPRPPTSLPPPPTDLAAFPAAAVPVFCRDCSFLI